MPKTFNRSGDLLSVAILQALNDSEMASPETLKQVLFILREAFARPNRCVSVIGDRQPKKWISRSTPLKMLGMQAGFGNWQKCQCVSLQISRCNRYQVRAGGR